MAGIEGLEFAGAAIALFILLFLALFPATLASLLYATLSKGAKVRRGC